MRRLNRRGPGSSRRKEAPFNDGRETRNEDQSLAGSCHLALKRNKFRAPKNRRGPRRNGRNRKATLALTLNLVGTARCAVRAAFSGATMPPADSRDIAARCPYRSRVHKQRETFAAFWNSGRARDFSGPLFRIVEKRRQWHERSDIARAVASYSRET